MLKLLAYFDSQAMWYDLFQAGLSDDLPIRLQSSLSEQISFESVIGRLVEYCLVEVQYAGQSVVQYAQLRPRLNAGDAQPRG